MTIRRPPVPGLDVFLDALTRPETMERLKPVEWNDVLRFARQTALVARLGYLAREAGIWERIPEKARQHFDSAAVISRDNQRMIRFEVARIADTLAHADVPFALLKGAAYVWSGLDMSRDRLSSDIDVLVAHRDLDAAEAAVKLAGWVPMKGEDDYDDYYYRAWMHELPPLRHRDSNTVIDIHHTILPVTSRLHPDPALLLGEMVPIEGGRLHVLAPKDIVLHAAAHLFYDGDFDRRLRDLYDLDRLLAHFGERPGFWDALVRRADILNLTRPLFYTLRYCAALLGTPVPSSVTERLAPSAPSALALFAMDRLVPRVIMPRNADYPSRLTSFAALLLYIRSHWLKMPPMLLARHLLRKAFKRVGFGAGAEGTMPDGRKVSQH